MILANFYASAIRKLPSCNLAIDEWAGTKHFEGVVNAISPSPITPGRIKAARAIAIAADFLQIALFPLFAEGFISMLDDALDVVVCLALTMLVGWHYSFLPSFILKVVPFADLVPSWTIAIFLATRQSKTEGEVTEVYSEVTPLPPRMHQNGGAEK